MLKRTLLLQCINWLTKCQSRLQEATWIFFVNALVSFSEKQQIMAVFMKIDKGNKGELEEADLIDGFV